MSRLPILVLGLGFFGKNWLKEVTSCPECEAASYVDGAVVDLNGGRLEYLL
jgi:hypothetical protein